MLYIGRAMRLFLDRRDPACHHLERYGIIAPAIVQNEQINGLREFADKRPLHLGLLVHFLSHVSRKQSESEAVDISKQTSWHQLSTLITKTKLLLTAAGIDFQKCDVSPVLPRKELEALGITYRRIPLLAIGKDIYADSRLIIDTILSTLGKGNVVTSPADKAFQDWGQSTFEEILEVVPTSFLSPEFVKDREHIFPLLKRPDFESLRPSGIAALVQRLRQVEDEFLVSPQGPYIAGQNLGVADLHVIFAIRWVLFNLGLKDEPIVSRQAFPKVWKLIDSLPEFKMPVLDGDKAVEIVKSSEYTAKDIGIISKDPLDISAGTNVTVENFDTVPGTFPQAGKLIGSSQHEFVLELDSGIRLHYPHIGYIVRKA
nr:hypothetical protein CFP56_09720 [Quercus suber]